MGDSGQLSLAGQRLPSAQQTFAEQEPVICTGFHRAKLVLSVEAEAGFYMVWEWGPLWTPLGWCQSVKATSTYPPVALLQEVAKKKLPCEGR